MSTSITRRQFGKLAGTAAVGLTGALAACTAPGEQPAEDPRPAPPPPSTDGFPDDFRWGTATSAYQIEGAVNEDGRGPSIWDTFTHTPGKVKNNEHGDVANDHYHRYQEDVQLMRGLGTNAYRFSIAWPRIFPQGRGTPNAKGMDFYERLVDALLANGITPYATLYHWDLPQALQDAGGWAARDTAQAFGDYAAHVGEKLSDRVKHFFTLNEFFTFVEWGHGTGLLAPGLKLPPARLNQVRHHAVLAHGLGVQALRAHARAGTQVGPAENITTAVPAIATPEHIKAAETATRELNAGYLTVMLEGRYTDAFLEKAGADAPHFTPEDLKIISSPVDFVGINVYMPNEYALATDQAPGYTLLPFNASHPRMASPWHRMGPEAIYWAPRHLRSLWNVPNIYITENGCGASDTLAADGTVTDTDRIMFMRAYLTQLQRATAEGIPVRGYFHWSLMDNFEWSGGYGTRFGLVHVDYATQRRTPKLSASFYREVIAANRVL
jgi:beta-glucosidase